MKIFVTQFEVHGKTYCGPNIIAEDIEAAEKIAESQGLEVQGELTDIVDTSGQNLEHTFH